MTKLESIVVSNTEPNSKNVLWYDNKRLLIFSNGHWSPIVDLDDIDVDNLPGVSNLQEALKSLNIKVDNKVDKVELDAALTAKQDKLVNSADVTVGEDDKLTVTDAVVKKAFIKRWENLRRIYNNMLWGVYDAANDKFKIEFYNTDAAIKIYEPSVTYDQAMAMMDSIQGSVLGYDSFSVRAPANLPPIGYQEGSGPRINLLNGEVCLYNNTIEVLMISVRPKTECEVHNAPLTLTSLPNLRAIIGVLFSTDNNNPLQFTLNGLKLPKLEFFRVKIKKSFDVRTSPLLTLDTMQYLVTNAQNTSPITVTVHPDVYAKLTGDTTNAAASALTADELAQWQALVTTANSKQITFATPE